MIGPTQLYGYRTGGLRNGLQFLSGKIARAGEVSFNNKFFHVTNLARVNGHKISVSAWVG